MEEEAIGFQRQLHVWQPKPSKLANPWIASSLSIPESGLAMRLVWDSHLHPSTTASHSMSKLRSLEAISVLLITIHAVRWVARDGHHAGCVMTHTGSAMAAKTVLTSSVSPIGLPLFEAMPATPLFHVVHSLSSQAFPRKLWLNPQSGPARWAVVSS